MGRKLKDYSDLIGKKFGNRTILDIVQKSKGWQYETCAVCKCNCGSIDEVPLTQLNTGHRLCCNACAAVSENKSTGIRNISYDRFNNNYVVNIARNKQSVIRRFHTLDEAIQAKELLLEHFAKYGYFDTKKLNDSYYTREPKLKSKHKGKDYSYLIGQKLDGWEIISIDELIKGQARRRNVQLRNSNGGHKELRLSHVLEALTRLPNKHTVVRSNTNIKNIYYSKRENRYMINVIRNSVMKHGRAKTLDEAIEIKEQFLNEFENEMKSHD